MSGGRLPVVEWEQLDDRSAGLLQRAKVPGGWLVRQTDDVLDANGESGYSWRTALCFVPDPAHTWGLAPG